jgi:predicted transposase/invertase (TIGR01784 family)
MPAKYINPFTDFGFKKIFGEEASKPQLMDFLNCLLPDLDLVDLSFRDKEKQPNSAYDRKAVYDIYCETSRGEKIIVELQKAQQNYFIDRTLYYASFPIQEQAQVGTWNYKLKAVYCIGILDFYFNPSNDNSPKQVVHTVPANPQDDKEKEKRVIHNGMLKDQDGKVIYDKLQFIYLEMPQFEKEEHELETRLDHWLYFIKHLEDFQQIPEIFKDSVFIRAFKAAEIAQYNDQERDAYHESLKILRDNYAVFEYALETATAEAEKKGLEKGEVIGLEKGLEEGLEKGEVIGLEKGQKLNSYQTIKKLEAKGKSLPEISDLLDLSIEEIIAIKKMFEAP